MRVLHFYPKDDAMVGKYVDTLCESMGLECVNERTTDGDDAQQRLRDRHFDVLHVHGCWRNATYGTVRQAFREGTRLVLSPHGQLEPWVQQDNYWKEKLPKRLLYQKRIVSQAYVVVIQGKMEGECMEKLGWNRRTAIVRNCLITGSITPKEMAHQLFMLYRKVMDSNTLALMNEECREAVTCIVKAGITGDVRWLPKDLPSFRFDEETWRRVLCYAHQERLTDMLMRGCRVLDIDVPDFDASKAACFLPDNYAAPESIEHAIGISFATENERLMATFRHLRKLVFNHRLTISHLVELDRELRNHGCNEELLAEDLGESRLLKLAGRTMQLMGDMTGLEEGFMCVPPVDDRTTRQLRKRIENHLKL